MIKNINCHIYDWIVSGFQDFNESSIIKWEQQITKVITKPLVLYWRPSLSDLISPQIIWRSSAAYSILKFIYLYIFSIEISIIQFVSSLPINSLIELCASSSLTLVLYLIFSFVTWSLRSIAVIIHSTAFCVVRFNGENPDLRLICHNITDSMQVF